MRTAGAGVLIVLLLFTVCTQAEEENSSEGNDFSVYGNATSEDMDFGVNNATSEDMDFGVNNATSEDMDFGVNNATSEDMDFGANNVTAEDMDFGANNATAVNMSGVVGTNPENNPSHPVPSIGSLHQEILARGSFGNQVDECATLRPCNNGGTCVDLVNGYECKCRSGYAGIRCEKIVDCSGTPCANGGQCSEVSVDGKNTIQCACLPGFAGPTCHAKDPCSLMPCYNGGTCRTDKGRFAVCKCVEGFVGDRCQYRLGGLACGSNPCLNEGECIESMDGTSHTCSCKPGFTGISCETVACGSIPCLNEGECIESMDGTSHTCSCKPGFTGISCETDIDECTMNPNICGSHSTCTNSPGSFLCTCDVGYEDLSGEGSKCKPDVCADNPCKNGGECVGDVDSHSFFCQCQDGYVGKTCSIARVCLSQPCANGGTCLQASPDQYQCQCTPQFTGERCEERSFRAVITNTMEIENGAAREGDALSGAAREGDDLSLQCEVQNASLYPDVEYLWLFQPYPRNAKIFAVVGHSNNYTATGINSKEDNGRYMCIASSGQDIARASVIIDIKQATARGVAADPGMDPAMQIADSTTEWLPDLMIPSLNSTLQPQDGNQYRGPPTKDDLVTSANLREVAGVIVTMMGVCVAAFLIVLAVQVATASRRQRAERKHSDIETGQMSSDSSDPGAGV